MILEKASFKAIDFACKNFHYSKSTPVNPIGFSVFNDEKEWCGCVVYSLGANPNIGKPYRLKQGQVIELTRMALNGKHEITSKVLSISMKLLPKFCPLVKMIVSFADANQNHIGTIYQASNFYFTGYGKTTPQYKVNGKWVHQRQLASLGYKIEGSLQRFENKKGLDKLRYIYPLDRSLIPLCRELSKPYPKKQCDGVLNKSSLASSQEMAVTPTPSLKKNKVKTK